MSRWCSCRTVGDFRNVEHGSCPNPTRCVCQCGFCVKARALLEDGES